MVCQRGLFSLFAPPMPVQEVPGRLLHPAQCVPPELPWVSLGSGLLEKAPFVCPRHLPHWPLRNLTLSLDLIETSLFLTCFHHLF